MAIKKHDWWLLPRPNAAAALKLFCFPYAGGSASIFRSWQMSLPEEVEVYGIQLPGRSNHCLQAPCRRLPDLMEQLVPTLVPLFDRPFALFGHSMGAIAIFEIVRWLRRYQHRLPECLFVSARRAPQIPDTSPPMYLMNDSEILAKIGALNGTPPDILGDVELIRLILPVLRADLELCETYEYTDSTPLSCPIIAFGGKDDREETSDMLEGWRAQTTGLFSQYMLDGDHFFIHSNEQTLLTLLRSELYKLIF